MQMQVPMLSMPKEKRVVAEKRNPSINACFAVLSRIIHAMLMLMLMLQTNAIVSQYHHH